LQFEGNGSKELSVRQYRTSALKRSNRARQAAGACGLESLESRLLLSSTASSFVPPALAVPSTSAYAVEVSRSSYQGPLPSGWTFALVDTPYLTVTSIPARGSVPAAPSNLTLAGQSAGYIHLTWTDNASNATGFRVERETFGSNIWDFVASTAKGVTSFTDSTVRPVTQYEYRVAAINPKGEFGPSNTATTTTPDVLPAVPSNLQLAVQSPHSIGLTWSDIGTNVTSFRVERQVAGSQSWAQLATTAAGMTDYSDLTLQPATQYSYRVAAINTAGSSGFSNVVDATTLISLPAAPTNLALTAYSAIRIDLTWVDNSDNETGFAVDRSTDGVNFVPVVTLPANTTLYSDIGLTPGTQYDYRIRAVNAAGSTSSPTNFVYTLANNTVAGDGWTTVVPSADSRIIYVSSSTGNDSNSGLSADAPVKTLAHGKSLTRDGMPDELLLKRGDVFPESLGEWRISGRSASEPLLISAYGQGARPIVDAPTGISSSSPWPSLPISNIDILGIDFYDSAHDPQSPNYNSGDNSGGGIVWLNGNNILVEDSVFRFHGGGIVFQGFYNQLVNIAIRRDVVEDSYATTAHSEGAYIENVDGLLLEGNLFDHNGWNSTVTGAGATVYNHDVYIKEDVTGVVVHDNIFANASSHGLQARSGGDIENNLFINDPIGMSFGYANDVMTPGGVSGTIAGNVFIGSAGNIGPRGWAIEISNTKPGGGTTIQNNVIIGDGINTQYYAAIKLDYGPSQPNVVGINDLTIQNNVIYGWLSAVWTNPIAVPGGTGQYALNGLVVKNNDFQNMTFTSQSWTMGIVSLGQAYDARYEQICANSYFAWSNPSRWFNIANVVTPSITWLGIVDSTGSYGQVAYVDPTRSVGSYNASIGGLATSDAFLSAARQQSQQNWNSNYTAASIIGYFRGGFARRRTFVFA